MLWVMLTRWIKGTGAALRKLERPGGYRRKSNVSLPHQRLSEARLLTEAITDDEIDLVVT
jgi:hypothetical protein